MKIIDTSCFEKLKIRSVSAKDLGSGFTYRRLSSSEFKSLELETLKDGWIFITDYFKFDVWIKMNRKKCFSLFSAYKNSSGDAFVSISPGTITGLCFIPFDSYNNFPLNIYIDYRITAAYETNIDISKFDKPEDVISFYHKYDILNTIYKDYKNENI